MDPSRSDTEEIARAGAALRRGALVAFPTETVYGLGADATNEEAVRRLFEVKGRPAEHPVIVHVPDVAGLERWGVPGDDALALAEAFWPGSLTVIVEKRTDPGRPAIGDAVTGGRPTVGVRAPDHPVALGLLAHARVPIAAPSANRFGRVSPTTAADVRADLGGDVAAGLLVLDGGPCAVGVESTIVDCTGASNALDGEQTSPVIRRVGGVARSEIERVLGRDVPVVAAVGSASGTLASHYAPRASVEVCHADLVGARSAALVAMGLRPGVLARVADLPDGHDTLVDGVVDLTVNGDLTALAHDLYRLLRRADELGLDAVLVVLPDAVDDRALGEVIADRLRRAAGSGSAP